MPLENDIEEILRRSTAGNPTTQRAWKAGGTEGATEASRDEAITLLIDNVNGLRDAVLRLAREIDEMRGA